MKKRTPWQILGLSEEADKKEIRKAYRRLAKRYHPDRNPGNPEAEDKFKEVQMAYETLMGRTAMSGRPHASDFPKEGSSRSAERVDPFLNFFTAMQALYPGNPKRQDHLRKKDERET